MVPEQIAAGLRSGKLTQEQAAVCFVGPVNGRRDVENRLPSMMQEVFYLLDKVKAGNAYGGLDTVGVVALAQLLPLVCRRWYINDVDARRTLAAVLHETKAFEAALMVYKEILDQPNPDLEPETVGSIMSNLGAALLDKGETEEARATIVRALRASPMHHLDRDSARSCWRNLAISDWRIALAERALAPSRARELAEEGLDAATRGQLPKYALLCDRLLAEFDLADGDVQSAARRARRMLAHSLASLGPRELLETLNLAGVALSEDGDTVAAAQVLEEAADLAQRSGELKIEAAARSNLGCLQQERGDAMGAKKSHSRAVGVARLLGDSSVLGRALVNQGNNAWTGGDVTGAEHSWREAIDELLKTGDHFELAKVARSFAELLRASGRVGAVENLQLRLSASGMNIEDLTGSLPRSADEASRDLEGALGVGNRHERLERLMALADARRREGRTDDSKAALEEAALLAEECGWWESAWRARGALGTQLRNAGDPEAALEQFSSAAGAVRRGTAADDRQRGHEQRWIYDGLIRCAIDLGRAEAAFSAHSLPLPDALAQLGGLERCAVLDLRATNDELLAFVVLSPDVCLDPLQEEQTNTSYGQNGRFALVRFAGINGAKLNEWDALGFEWGKIDALKGVKDIRWSPNILRVCEDVQARLMGPIERRLTQAGVNRVFVIPDWSLQRIPLHLANTQVDGKRHYIIDRLRIDLAPSWAAIGPRRCRRTLLEHKALLVYSNPRGDLQAVAGEVRRIQMILQRSGVSDCQILADSEATKSRVLDLLPHFTLLHFATHGLFDVKSPSLSGLLLWDGVLNYAEISGAHLQKEALIVMSGCKGLLVDPTAALARHASPAGAFLDAGAATVIASLVDVPDKATGELMELLYEQFCSAENDDLGEALRQAAIHFRNGGIQASDPSTRDPSVTTRLTDGGGPFYWGGFAAFGR